MHGLIRHIRIPLVTAETFCPAHKLLVINKLFRPVYRIL